MLHCGLMTWVPAASAASLLVFTGLGLVGGREQRFRELFGLLQPVGQVNAADLSRGLVVVPAGTDQVTTHNGFDGQRLQSLHDERAFRQLRLQVGILDDIRDRQLGELVVDDVAHHAEPEQRQARQHLAFAGDRVRHDDVVSGQPIGRDDQQVMFVDTVNVADLTAADQGKFRNR